MPLVPTEEALAERALAGTPLAGQGAAFVAAGARHDVDWRLLMAIAGAETSYGRTGNAVAIHNPFGLGPGRSYSDWPQAIDTAARTIADYRRRGLTTVPEIQSRWAPSGAGNDPQNLNSNWTRNVTAELRRLGGDPENVTRDPRPGLTRAIGTRDSNPTIIERAGDAIANAALAPVNAVLAFVTDWAPRIIAFILLGVIGVWLVSQGASRAFGTPTVGAVASTARQAIPK